MIRTICFLILLGLVPNFVSAGADSALVVELEFSNTGQPPMCFLTHKKLARPKVGLALSGGGTRGIAQIGILSVLEENDIPIDLVVGTSIGGIIGGLYASGYRTAELLKLVKNIKWQDILLDTTSRSDLFIGKKEERNRHIIQLRLANFKPYLPTAFTPGQKLSMLLSDVVFNAPFHANNFQQLPIPLQIVATDMLNGKKVIIKEGNLAEAMRASAAFPLLFEPVELDSMLLVDGGLTSNIPVDETRLGNVDLVIAIDTSARLRDKQQIQLPWEIADQVTSIMLQEKNKKQLQNADVVIAVDVEHRDNMNFTALDSLYEIGRTRALKAIPVIQQKLKSLQYQNCDSTRFFVSSYSVTGLIGTGAGEIEKIIKAIHHKTVLKQDIEIVLADIYRTGDFQDVHAVVCQCQEDENNSGKNAIRINICVKENPILRSISFENNHVVSDSILLSKITSRLNAPINHRISEKDILALVSAYRERGYSLAKISQINFNELTGALVITIDEGVISKISLESDGAVKDFVVLRELPVRTGQVFNLLDANTGIKNVFGTGLFSFVIINVDELSPGYELRLYFKSRKYDLIRMGGRYDRERENRFFLEFVNENLFGSGNPIALHAEYGYRDRRFSLDFRTDRIFNSYLSSNFSIYYSLQKYYAYEMLKNVGEYQISRLGFDISVGQQMERLGNVSIFSRLEQVNYESTRKNQLQSEELQLHTIGLVSKVDTRDKVPFPTRGRYHLFRYEINFEKKSFFKFYNTLESYFTPVHNLTFIPRLSWGTSELTTPFVEQYQFGGLESMYGLRKNQMNGRHLFLISMEAIIKLPVKIIMFDSYLSGRYDLGTVWRSHEDIKPMDMMQGVGIRLAIDSLIGPIQIAYGRNSSGKSQYYVSIGHEF